MPCCVLQPCDSSRKLVISTRINVYRALIRAHTLLDAVLSELASTRSITSQWWPVVAIDGADHSENRWRKNNLAVWRHAQL